MKIDYKLTVAFRDLFRLMETMSEDLCIGEAQDYFPRIKDDFYRNLLTYCSETFL